MEIGAVIELTLPASGMLSFDPFVYDESPDCLFQGQEALPDEIQCDVEKNDDGREVITWVSSHDPVGAYETFSVSAIECGTNPSTTEETDPFEVRIYS